MRLSTKVPDTSSLRPVFFTFCPLLPLPDTLVCLVTLDWGLVSSSHRVRKHTVLWLFEKSEDSQTYSRLAAGLFLVTLFAFLKKPDSGLHLRHPTVNKLLYPSTFAPQTAYKIFIHSLHRKLCGGERRGPGWGCSNWPSRLEHHTSHIPEVCWPRRQAQYMVQPSVNTYAPTSF